MRNKIIDETGAEVDTTKPTNPVPADRGAVLLAARELMALVPDAPEDDGSGILGRILAADDWEDLNSQTSLPNAKDVANRTLRYTGVVKRESDLETEDDGSGLRLDHYLVVDAVDIHNGEVVRFQTSAASVTLAIAKMVAFGKVPFVGTIRPVDKPTRRGFRPLNLTVEAVS